MKNEGRKLAALVIAGLITQVTGAHAQAPANDNFADAAVFPGPIPATVSASNVGATMEAGEPNHDGQTTNSSVWWSWIAPADGQYSLDTAGSDFDTVIAVYDGVLLLEVASDDEEGGNSTSALTFDAVAGITYYFVVAAWFNTEPGAILLSVAAVVVPPNDDFANASPLTGTLPIVVKEANLDLATQEANEPNRQSLSGAGTVWWRWTADISGPVAVDAATPQSEPRLEVYSGLDLESLTLVQGASSFNGFVNFNATIGEVYYVRVAPDAFFVERLLILTLRTFAPPANDQWSDATEVSSTIPFSLFGTLIDATIETGEPGVFGDGRTVWWKWTPTQTQPVQLVSSVPEDLNYFTRAGVGVFTGAGLGTLNPIAGDGDGEFVFFAAEAGVEYFIRALGYSYYPPAEAFTIRAEQGPHAPSNDTFDSAIELTGLPTETVSGTLLGASRSPGDPADIASKQHNVWYRWTAPSTGGCTIVLEEEGSSFVEARAFTGATLAELALVPSSVANNQFEVVAGTTYHISVYTTVREPDDFFTVQLVPPPPNDNFADRMPIAGALPAVVSGTHEGAGGEPSEPFSPQASVWFEWTPSQSGKRTLATSDDDAVIAVYTGDSIDQLVSVPDLSPSARNGLVWFDAVGGVSYKIQVEGFDAEPFMLGISTPPANDDFAAATVIAGTGPLTLPGDLVGATFEPNVDAKPSVWWRWTAEADREYTIQSDFDMERPFFDRGSVEIFTGSDPSNLQEVGRGGGRAEFDAVNGTTYHFRLSLRDPIIEDGALSVSLFPHPENDDFADATPIATNGIDRATQTGTLSGASREGNEPRSGRGRNSVWWEWTAPTADLVSIDTFGSVADTVLSVYRGPDIENLSLVRRCDDASESGASRVAFVPESGITYRIQIYGTGARETGDVTLHVQQHGPPTTALTHVLWGRAYMEGEAADDLTLADSHFATALQLDQNEESARMLGALTSFALLQQQPEFMTLITQWGFVTEDPNLRAPGYDVPRDEMGNPDLPAGASTDQAIVFANSALLPALAEIELALASVPGAPFAVPLSDAENGSRFMRVDAADVDVMRSIALALKAAVHFTNTWNVSFDVGELIEVDDSESFNVERLLAISAQFLERNPGDERQQLKAAVQAADVLYQPAWEFIKNRPAADGDAHLFYVRDGSDPEAQEIADDIADASRSLDGSVTWDGVEIDLSAFIDSDVSLRALMPLMRKNKAIPSSAPDPSMDGAVPAATHAALNAFLKENRLLRDISTFLAWLENTLPNATDEERERMADGDRDGLDNFTEWVFDLDPTRANSEREILRAGILPDPGDPSQRHFALTFVRLLNVAGIVYRVRVSDDLVTWDDSEAQLEMVGDPVPQADGTTEQVTYRVKTPVSSSLAGKYLSVRVTEAPPP